MAIKDIKIGDTVISFDESKNEFTTSVVGEIVIHDGIKYKIPDFSRNKLIELIVTFGDEETRTEVTDNHLYFTPEYNTYKPIGKFAIGEEVLAIHGKGIVKAKSNN